MGKELAEKYSVARQTFEEADEALGFKLSHLCFEGPEEKLRMTEITQPAILTASTAAWRVLCEKGLNPSFVAGQSLGEYSAHVAAGTLSFSDAVRTVRTASEKFSVPAATWAEYSPKLCPATKLGFAPFSRKTRQAAVDAVRMAGCVISVRRS